MYTIILIQIFKKKIAPTNNALIVDDDSVNRAINTKYLSRNGLFEIKIAENGKEAVDYFHAVNQFDFVIMDMEMPVVDDFEVYVFIFSGFFTSTP